MPVSEALAAYDGSSLAILRRVARCKDCALASPLDPAKLPWLPDDAAEQTTGYYRCARHSTYDDPWIVEADGFCAWGWEEDV